jgi:hypothetical protein
MAAPLNTHRGELPPTLPLCAAPFSPVRPPVFWASYALDRSGFIQLRRGLFEHVRDGRLSFFETSLYVAIIVDANPATGICYGSAGLFATIFGLAPRTVREALEKLEKKGYSEAVCGGRKAWKLPHFDQPFSLLGRRHEGNVYKCFNNRGLQVSGLRISRGGWRGGWQGDRRK